MNVGDIVKIVKCDICSTMVGKIAKIKSLSEEDGGQVELQFGRGRPCKNRPTLYPVDAVIDLG